MADAVTEVLRDLKENERVRQTRFTSKFLHGVAEEVYHGFGEARVLLGGKLDHSDADIRRQAEVLLEEVLPVLETCERIRRRPELAGAVIKMLPVLQSKELNL